MWPAMIDNAGARIVFVASDAGRVGSLGETPYAGADMATVGAALASRQEAVQKMLA